MMNAKHMLTPDSIATMRGLCERNIRDGDGGRASWTNEQVFVYLTGLAETQTRIAELEGALRKLVGDMDDLIANSSGVYGLHQNGDGAQWGTLTAGGQFEAWLGSLDEARAALAKSAVEGGK